MKKILLLFLISTSLYGYVENLEYVQTIDHCARYEATLLEHNGRLYVDAKGAIEEYIILPDGSLDLNSYINKYHYDSADAIILGDTLYVGNHNYYYGDFSEIYVVDISGDEMELIEIKSTNSTDGIFRFGGNDDYFVYKVSDGGIYSTVLDRTTLEYVTQLSSGGFFSIRDTLLFKQMDYLDSTYVFITNISDIYNPVDICSLKVGENQQNIGYFFHDNLLLITQNTHVVIVDISDIENPELVTTIDDLPGVPFVNFFTTLLIYDNYLMFGNQETKFWIYDISNIYAPVFVSSNQDFVGGSTYRRSLLLNGDDIYYARKDRNICHINANQLPELNVINEYGNNGQFHFYHFVYPYILYSNPHQLKQYYVNINEIDPEVHLLAESPSGWVSPVCNNDSLICFMICENLSEDQLVICNYDEDNIEIVHIIPLGTTNFNYIFFRENYLILTGYNPGNVSINEINEDYTLNEVGYFTVGPNAYLLDQTSQCNEDYLFIKSECGDDKIIDIFENQPPFIEVRSFNLSMFNRDHDNLYLLSEDRILLIDYTYPGYYVQLCEYSFPVDFELLDTYSSQGYFNLHDDVLVWHEDYDGWVRYYSWLNDEIELLGNYNFGVEIYDNFFLPEVSKLYAVGRYNIQEYTCDYVSIEDNMIPKLESILSNYPNPFSPATTISFSLNTENTEDTEIVIYNLKGQVIRKYSIFNPSKAGHGNQYSITWDGRDENGKPVSSGIYFYKLQTQQSEIIKKMLLLK